MCPSVAVPPALDGRVQVVLSHIDANLQRELSLERIAGRVNISPSRLRHLFKQHVGMGFTAYVKARRLRKAKELIETTFLSVKEIMSRVGVADESHFVRDFRDLYGAPPMRYRARRWAQPDSPMNSQPSQ